MSVVPPALTGQGLYRATCDPTPRYDPPEGAVELVGLRRRHSKSFLLPNGLHRQVITIGPQHYRDGDLWHEIDTRLVGWQAGLLECRRAGYFFRNLPGRAGFSFKSRAGGFATLRLVRVGGLDVAGGLACEADNNCLYYRGIAPDADLHFQLLPAKVQAWATLHSEHAPREWEWEVLHAPPVGVAVNVRGWDAAGRAVEIVSERATERLSNGTLRTRLVKRWTGAVWERDQRTRERRRVEPAYPVVLDPDISEEIVAMADNGTELVDYGSWYDFLCHLGHVAGSGRNPGWRFQGVAVPNSGDSIDLATFKINCSLVTGAGGSGTMYGYDADDAAAFSGTNRPSVLAKTTASASWSPSTTGQKTVDVTSVVQEIVDRVGWSSGNDISLFALEASSAGNYSAFYIYFSSGNHGRLEIDYTAGGGGSASLPPRRQQRRFFRRRG